MVQQTVDSKFSQYGLASSETGFPHHDKQQAVQLAAKKTALRDLQNVNRLVVPKSMGSSQCSKDGGPAIETTKVSGAKRPALECLSPPHPQSPASSNVASGHLVYVRRKPEPELGKSGICDNTNYGADCQQSRQLGDPNETTHHKSEVIETKISVPEVVHVPRVSLLCLPSGKPSVPPSLGKSCKILPPGPPVDSNYLSVTPANPSFDYPKRLSNQHWEERYRQLQNLLKNLDQSNQDDYIQMLRSLSSVELSRHAVELEKRSIQLSLEEAKEMQRVRLLDVLGKYPKNFRAPSTQQGQSDK